MKSIKNSQDACAGKDRVMFRCKEVRMAWVNLWWRQDARAGGGVGGRDGGVWERVMEGGGLISSQPTFET